MDNVCDCYKERMSIFLIFLFLRGGGGGGGGFLMFGPSETSKD